MPLSNVVLDIKKSDFRAHGYIWHTSQYLLGVGQERVEGSFHQFLSSLVFTAFAFEGFLNWLGERSFSDWNSRERESPMKKLDVLSEHLGYTYDKSREPYQTVNVLFRNRNLIAHPRPESLMDERTLNVEEGLDDRLGEFLKSEWQKYANAPNAERARKDVYEIAKALHEGGKECISAARLDYQGARAFVVDQDDPGPFFGGFQEHVAG